MVDFKDRFHDALDYFYDKNFHLAGRVSQLGYPEIIGRGYPPTAGVFWDSDKKKARFVFNGDFCKTLEEEQFYFVVAHEAMHVLNGHIFTLKTEVDKMKNQGKNMSEIMKWQRKFNIAADCVINDTLTNLYGLPRLSLPEDSVGKILYGKNVVGCDCHDLAVTDVMDLLPQDQQQGEDGEEGEDGQSAGGGGAGPGEHDVDNHDTWDSFFEDDGSINRDFVDAMREFVEDNMDNSAMSQQDLEQLEELEEKMESCSDGYAGATTARMKQKKMQFQNASLKWDRILFRKVERGKYEDVWSKTNRKLSSFYPDVILPYNKPKEVEDIFIAIDVSGSIDYAGTDLFVSLVKNTPKHFKINAVTFNTACYPFDIKSSHYKVGGGTSFNIIEEYIQKNFKKYPKAVFVLTDGEGNAVQPKYPSRWTWLLYGRACDIYCTGMSTYNIGDLLK